MPMVLLAGTAAAPATLVDVLSGGFDLADLPGLVEEAGERAVQAEDGDEPRPS